MYSAVGFALLLCGADALSGDGKRLSGIRKASPSATDIRSLPVPSFTPGPDVPEILYGDKSRIYRRTQYKAPGDWSNVRFLRSMIILNGSFCCSIDGRSASSTL
jgi:hypothetical protein